MRILIMQSRTAEETRRHMDSLYGEFMRQQGIVVLNPANVPKVLWPWIPYAEFWGIIDDYDRDALVASAPQRVRDDLIVVVEGINSELDLWLAGKEASVSPPSDEYCAFSTMRMAADYAVVRSGNPH